MSTLELLRYSESDRKKILATYGRTPENIHKDTDNIKEWLKKQPHLSEIPTDRMIENFLIMNKFRIEDVKQRIDMYYTVRSLIPEFFNTNPNSERIKNVMNVLCAVPLTQLTPDLYRVFIAYKVLNTNLDTSDTVAHTSLTYHHFEMQWREDCSLGMVYIYDVNSIKPADYATLTLQHLKKVTFVTNKVFKAKFKAIHIINVTPLFENFLTFSKPFLKSKALSRLFLHRTLDSLYEMVPKHILPSDYGGQEKSIKELTDEWQKVFLKHDSLFENLRNIKVNEELRPGKPLESDILGIQGNFRKLDID